jgi:3-isopropylmalate/(R)-2-methylmalate dehydratase small subunit
MTGNIISGLVYVLGDKIDTDQIIPADKLTWYPSKPDERLKLGSYALDGLPDDLKEKQPFITEEERGMIASGQSKAKYNIIVAGRGFGCGSSREHAANALGAAGVEIVVAKGYARIFFENCVATGELIPSMSREDISDRFRTGDKVEVDLDKLVVYNRTQDGEFALEPLGYVLPMVKAGGLFAYARQKGLIPPRPEE